MRESPLLEQCTASVSDVGEVYGMSIALHANLDGSTENYVADLSALRRQLFVGPAVPGWLARHDISVPNGLLEYRKLDHDAVIVHLHRQQYLLIDAIAESPYDKLFALEQGRHDDVLVLPYEAAEIACGGPHVDALIAELCPMDIASIDRHNWITTRFAHCELALRRLEDPVHYRVLCSPADARFVFGILCEVTRERDGAVLGFDDYSALLKRGDRTP